MTTEIPDFTRERPVEPIRFRIDDDVFLAAPEAPPAAILDVTDVGDLTELAGLDPNKASPQDLARLQAGLRAMQLRLMAFLDRVLLPESAERFAERLRNAHEKPISIEQTREVVAFLISRYSDRPTTPPTSSSEEQGGNGASSTAFALPGT